MKRFFLFAVCAILLCAFCVQAEGVKKWDEMPAYFKVTVLDQDRVIGDKDAFVHKEYLETSNTKVDELASANGVELKNDTVYFRFLVGKTDERRDSNTN